ncbi:MAG: DUF3299 domain-containing protein [Pirellulales bacterium]
MRSTRVIPTALLAALVALGPAWVGATVPALAIQDEEQDDSNQQEKEPAKDESSGSALTEEEKNKVLPRTFDDIKFEMEKGAPFDRSLLTEDVKKLFGRKIRIRGYILPTAQQKGIEQFVLVRDNMECCFGPGAALYDCILVDMAKGKSASFTVRPVLVEGTFELREIKGPDGNHLAIYGMKAELVK